MNNKPTENETDEEREDYYKRRDVSGCIISYFRNLNEEDLMPIFRELFPESFISKIIDKVKNTAALLESLYHNLESSEREKSLEDAIRSYKNYILVTQLPGMEYTLSLEELKGIVDNISRRVSGKGRMGDLSEKEHGCYEDMMRGITKILYKRLKEDSEDIVRKRFFEMNKGEIISGYKITLPLKLLKGDDKSGVLIDSISLFTDETTLEDVTAYTLREGEYTLSVSFRRDGVRLTPYHDKIPFDALYQSILLLEGPDGREYMFKATTGIDMKELEADLYTVRLL